MENSLKGLILAAGTVITCIVIGLGFYIAREAQDTASSGAGQIGRLNAELQESDKVMYDGLAVSGSEVLHVINRFASEDLGILVETKKSTTCYGMTLSEDRKSLEGESSAEVKDAWQVTSNTYINPNSQFIGEVLRDENETIVGIRFVQQD